MKEAERRWIDVREFREFAGGYIPGSELVPLGELRRECAEWERTQPLMMVCKSGRRAEVARELLKGRGFLDVEVLCGGVDRWRESGRPMLKMERKPWSLARVLGRLPWNRAAKTGV